MSSGNSFSQIAALSIHDVKNDLAQLAAEAQARGDRNSQNIAMRSADTLSRLLCFYKSETHDLHVQIEAQDPHELIVDLLERQASRIQAQTQIQVRTHVEEAPDLWFYDSTLIDMVLANGLQNALRFARQNIDISVTTHATYLEICIQDDGTGYPPNLLSESYDSSPISMQGTGLGISLARRILALHRNGEQQGEIKLSNDNGAKFQVLLP